MASTPDPAAPRGFTVVVPDLTALPALARALVAALPPEGVVTLEGELGAGKTTFVKAVAEAAGLDPADVVSPTFGLIHVHRLPPREGRPERVVHADLYRLAGSGDLREIGWEDAIAGSAWVFVEWPQRGADALPRDRLDVAIRVDSETGRTFTFIPRGDFRLTGW
jgi:tRNA threonylcarbamoyladenosine biosynthesis protein TsaE